MVTNCNNLLLFPANILLYAGMQIGVIFSNLLPQGDRSETDLIEKEKLKNG